MIKINLLNIISIIIIIIILIIIPKNNQSHPILIISIIIIYRILITINISIWKINFLYSIILFLIIIRGLIIIFLYFSRLISNEKINWILSYNITFIIIINIIFFIIYIINKKSYNYNIIFNTTDNLSLIEINNKKFQNILNLYNYPFNNLTIICIIFLLIRLFSIIKISSTKSKPLRKISN